MYQEERMASILDYLKEHKRISVDHICRMFNVSRDTARRDLVKLEERGDLNRTRGGAVLPDIEGRLKTYQDRLMDVSEEKRAIGKLAASLIKNGENIILDTSTTVQACAESLTALDITVVTNSINQVEILSQKDRVEMYLLGGRLNKHHRFLYGTSAVEKLAEYHADKAFIGVGGIMDTGLAIQYEEDGMIKKKMIDQADQVILLTDHSKFGKPYFYQFASLQDIDVLVTDRLPDEPFLRILKQAGVTILTTEDDPRI
ncbi:DeoR/GlpR family DNA-binding transcription regulator [Bacillus marinisedimentorum]|uniref:DeoR/GlpR family DNA-binding transcription regulator n=1 Tax=Bacillus marinisedimentorum TaxID=1821260 RepID=UPI0008730299|nr:DeoR/GlpR family DNA-binding transcription regulator [Bacillus marinisedimentorum]